MADQRLVGRLKRSVGEFNDYRRQNSSRNIDFAGADFSGANLRSSNLSGANLSRAVFMNTRLRAADLRGATLDGALLGGANLCDTILINASLSSADLRRANLNGANLGGADLSSADLGRADLNGASLIDAILVGADLSGADLSGADLRGADLSNADLSSADLNGADLSEACLSGCQLFHTHFCPSSIDNCQLETLKHLGPSFISHETLLKLELPADFLRKCGVAEMLIDHLPAIRGSMRPIQYYSCFISYSHIDKALALRLHNDLQDKGIRVWLDEKSTRVGDRIIRKVDQAIRSHERVILLCSKTSLHSEWVEKEMKRAFAKETREKRDVILPLKLDKALDTWDHEYAVDIQERLYADFSGWSRGTKKYDAAFERLVAALNAGAKADRKKEE